MNLQKLLTDPPDVPVLQISAEDLQDVLGQSQLLYETETHLAGPIRILELEGHILIQEQLERSDVFLLRELRTRLEADRFVSERLETYERMWDGCGCKIDYLG